MSCPWKTKSVHLVVCVLLAAGCGSVSATNDDAETDTNSPDVSDDPIDDPVEETTPADVVTDGSGDGWYSDECHVVRCQTHTYQCGDCLDNDGDDLIDSRDPDCLGPCDNNEGGFNTQIPGGNSAPCRMDCYFDQDSGGGNDDCQWDHRCDDLEPVEINECDYSVACESCDCTTWAEEQSDQCYEVCVPLVPNGCDCFGCCVLNPDDEEPQYRFIGSPGCNLEDPESCSPCTPVGGECSNECGPCELCLGRTELPPECYEDPDRCPEDVQPCGLEGDDPCPEGYYCVTGCCQMTMI